MSWWQNVKGAVRNFGILVNNTMINDDDNASGCCVVADQTLGTVSAGSQVHRVTMRHCEHQLLSLKFCHQLNRSLVVLDHRH